MEFFLITSAVFSGQVFPAVGDAGGIFTGEGTYALPEAQLDRFMLKVVLDYPTLEEERLIVRRHVNGAFENPLPLVTTQRLLQAREYVKKVYIDERIEQYVTDIVFATRYPEQYGMKEVKAYIAYGGSPRASICLAQAARARAFMKRRGYVIPEDVRDVAHDVLRHRIGLTYAADAAEVTTEDVITEILNKVQVP